MSGAVPAASNAGGFVRRCATIALIALLAGPAAGLTAVAGEVSGSARLSAGSTDSTGVEEDQVDQRYTVNFDQPVTSYLRFGLSYRHTSFRSLSDEVADFDRSSDEPGASIAYSRANIGATVSYHERRTRGSGPTDEFELTSLLANLTWRPDRGPTYALRYRDESNVADVGVFGRDVQSRFLNFDALYQAGRWQTRYGYETAEIENNTNSFGFDQSQHRLEFLYDDRFWDDRVFVSTDARVARIEQDETVTTGTVLAEPVPAIAGLYAVDTTPEIGPLDPAFGLIDGDQTTPASPLIDIGAGNTFRNIGLDLGVTRRLSRVEIAVDGISDPGLVWDVWGSTDNLIWTVVPGVMTGWDGALLRYTLSFPESTQRYVKAVNISVNSQATVLVTELRALLDVDQLGRSGRASTTYRVNGNLTFLPNERVRGRFSLGLANEQSLALGISTREYNEVSYNAQVGVDLRDDVELRIGYRFVHFVEELEPRLVRDEMEYSAALDWTPLPTADASFIVSRRDERDAAMLIRSTDTIRLRSRLQIYEDLSVVSEVVYSDSEDPFAGFRQSAWRWLEIVEARPTTNWSLGATMNLSWFDSSGVVTLNRRSTLGVFTQWRPTTFVTILGDWSISDDDERRSYSDRYTLSWSPGRKINASLSLQRYDSDDLRDTRSATASVNYRVNAKLQLFATLLRSRFEQTGIPLTEIDSYRFGLSVFF